LAPSKVTAIDSEDCAVPSSVVESVTCAVPVEAIAEDESDLMSLNSLAVSITATGCRAFVTCR
jgi:hypothetical protein